MLNWFKNSQEKWDHWFQKNMMPQGWHVLDFNRHHFRDQVSVLHFERHGKNAEIINIYPKKKELELISKQAKAYFTPTHWHATTTKVLEIHLSPSLDVFKQKLISSPPGTGNRTQEAKGYEWLKTSMVVLNKALNELKSDQVLQTSIFIGERDHHQELRIIVFNLDLNFIYLEEKRSLHVRCFNKHGSDNFDYNKADFDGLFQALAYPVFDMAILLTQEISKAILKECKE